MVRYLEKVNMENAGPYGRGHFRRLKKALQITIFPKKLPGSKVLAIEGGNF